MHNVIAALSAFILVLLAISPARASAPLDAVSMADAREGLDHLYHARVDSAREAFERIRARHPDSPAADFLLGGIEWHRVSTGPGGFVEGGEPERAFFARMDAAIELGEQAVRVNRDDVSALFFLGGAYGYKARYLAIQEKWWDAYRTGRRGVGHLERVVKLDPDMADAYLGLGIYHYYTDVIPTVLRVLGNLVGIRGDRDKGLAEIRRALAEGTLVEVECRFFLAEIHTTFENDHWRGLGYSRSLRDEYPENELFTWLNARILDELNLADLATAEWTLLRQVPRDRWLNGFLDYRLARTRLFGGDFAGAARDFERHFREGDLGSRRITMWGRLRYGECLDFLGRAEEALEQYRKARDLDASDSAKRRANDRIAAGEASPPCVSLPELAETASILLGTRVHGEEALRRIETQVTGPSRGLSRDDRDLFFAILRDLAEARMRRDDPEGCVAAVDRALDTWHEVPKDARARLLALRARALYRAGRTEEARRVLGSALFRASQDVRVRIEREAALMERAPFAASTAPPVPGAGEPVTFGAPDGGELLLEVEGDFLPAGMRLPLVLSGTTWSASWRVAEADTIRYRFLRDGELPRIDPTAPRVVLRDDGAWGLRPLR